MWKRIVFLCVPVLLLAYYFIRPVIQDPQAIGGLDRDELGYPIPLDIHRPRDLRPDRPRQSALAIEEIRASLGSDPFPTFRLGPDDGHTQNETSIDADGDTIIAGWNQADGSTLVMGVGRSGDGGETWSHTVFSGHSVASDPVVVAGGGGVWYFTYIATGGIAGSDYEVMVRRSLDDGISWAAPVLVTDNNGFDDKPYMDARGNEVLVAWADFSLNPTRIVAARSLDGGNTWGNFSILVTQPGQTGNGALPLIAPDGTYYVFWRNGQQTHFWMARSQDQGANWTPETPIMEMSPLPNTLPGGFRMVNLPSAAIDPLDGHLVVVGHSQASGNPDILLTRSDDMGDTWTVPIKVNDDIGTEAQFFPWVTMDEQGLVYVVWYDRRLNGFDIDVYMATSLDGGSSFEANVRLTGSPYTPVLPWEGGLADFIGDYNGIAASQGKVYPFFQDAREGNQDVYVVVVETQISYEDLLASWPNNGVSVLQLIPLVEVIL